jgi:hypothetical protein
VRRAILVPILVVIAACHAATPAVAQLPRVIPAIGDGRVTLGGTALPAATPNSVAGNYDFQRILQYNLADTTSQYSQIILYVGDSNKLARARLALRSYSAFLSRQSALRQQFGPGTTGKNEDIGCDIWEDRNTLVKICLWQLAPDVGMLEFWEERSHS